MAITAKGKLKEMIKNGKADPNVQTEYDELEEEYRISREEYREAREELEEAEEKLNEAIEKKKETPLRKRRQINKKISLLKAKVEKKQKEYSKAKQSYKSRLKAFRDLKRIIRQQSRACKAYEDFFAAEAEAKRLGISIPRYISIEIIKHKQAYRRVRFSIDKSGINKIEMPEIECTYDLRSLIREETAKRRRAQVERLIQNTQKAFEKINPAER